LSLLFNNRIEIHCMEFKIFSAKSVPALQSSNSFFKGKPSPLVEPPSLLEHSGLNGYRKPKEFQTHPRKEGTHVRQKKEARAGQNPIVPKHSQAIEKIVNRVRSVICS
jgi:hypothetical protein